MNNNLKELWKKKNIHKSNLNKFDYSHIINFEKMKPRQILWHLINQINEIPNCKECNNKVNWDYHNHKYLKYCSLNCSYISIDTKEKRKKTNLKKYGVISTSQVKEIKEKQEKTILKRYGNKHPNKSEKVREKYKQTNLIKYGVESSNQKNFSEKTKEILFNKEKFNEFMKDKTTKIASNILNINQTTILNYTNKYNTQYLKTKSNFELEMEEFLKENNILFQQNSRQKISPKELDFYLPDYNLAIECNGNYWHSLREEGYHINKYNLW